MSVHVFKYCITSSAAALHNVGIRNPHCMLYRGAIMLQIMKTKMRQPGTLQNPLKSVRYVVRIIHNHFVFEADLD